MFNIRYINLNKYTFCIHKSETFKYECNCTTGFGIILQVGFCVQEDNAFVLINILLFVELLEAQLLAKSDVSQP